MKTSTLPPVRVDDDLRQAAESVLAEGESLSAFIESTVRDAVSYRVAQADFHSRGQASLEHFRKTGMAHSTEEVVAHLQTRLDARRKRLLG